MSIWLRLIVQLYPRAWRERYQDEFLAMLELCEISVWDYCDMAFSSLETRLLDSRGKLMKDLLNRVTGLVALVSVLMLLMALLFVSDENTAEFLLVTSPVLSLALIPSLHRVLNIHAPKATNALKWIGISSILVLAISVVVNNIATNVTLAAVFALGFTWLVGLWLIGVNILGIRTRVFTRMLALIGIAVGVAWMYTMSYTIIFSAIGTSYSSYPQLMSIQNISLFTLIFGYIIWALGLSVLLISGTLSRKLQLVY